MVERVQWDQSGQNLRIATVELCGWHNKNGNATPMGRRIARTCWKNLTAAAKNVLKRHGIQQ